MLKKTKPTGISVNSDSKDDKVNINDSLTYFNKNQFFKTRAFIRDKGYKYTWLRNRKFLFKKMNLLKPL